MKITKADNITEQHYNTISEMLYDHNLKSTKEIDSINCPLEILIFENDNIIGGLYGRSIWGTLEIQKLVILKDYRGKGLGQQLMNTAIEEARLRKCKYISLNTFSFQAPEFYENLGFVKIGIEQDFPDGFDKLYYRKTL